MSLETHIAGSEDRLIDGLHFAGRNTASYIVSRKDATFHPSSASNFKPSGVRPGHQNRPRVVLRGGEARARATAGIARHQEAGGGARRGAGVEGGRL